MDWKNKYRKILLGLGFDTEQGHIRITRGRNFYLFGGSKKTHAQMQEVAIKFNEQLKKKHKSLEEISEKEFIEIARKCGVQNIKDLNKKRF